MPTKSLFAMAFALAVLLSGCAPSVSAVTRSPAPSTPVAAPDFLAAEQSEADRLPDGVAEGMRIDPGSTRYQGSWDGRQVFLGVKNSGSVCLVMTTSSDPSKWTAACGDRNSVVIDELPNGTTAKYLPMATKAAPEGWTRLSDFVFVK